MLSLWLGFLVYISLTHFFHGFPIFFLCPFNVLIVNCADNMLFVTTIFYMFRLYFYFLERGGGGGGGAR